MTRGASGWCWCQGMVGRSEAVAMRTVIALWDAALLSLGRSSGPSKVSQTHDLPTFNTPQALSSDEQTALCRASVSSLDPLVLT